MSRPRLLLLQHNDAGFAITRWTAEGVFAGDTWHPSIEDAEGTAAWEYGDALTPWQPVPQALAEADDVMDILLSELT